MCWMPGLSWTSEWLVWLGGCYASIEMVFKFTVAQFNAKWLCIYDEYTHSPAVNWI